MTVIRKIFPFDIRTQSRCYYLDNLPSIDSEALRYLKEALEEKKLGDPALDYLVEAIENQIGDRRIELKKEKYDLILAKDNRQVELDKAYWPKLKSWVDHNVQPGMLLKMTGCRDGVGLREVIGIQGNLISCYKLKFPILPWKGVPTQHYQKPLRTQVTNHHWKKVLGPSRILSLEEVLKEKKQFTYTSLRKTL